MAGANHRPGCTNSRVAVTDALSRDFFQHTMCRHVVARDCWRTSPIVTKGPAPMNQPSEAANSKRRIERGACGGAEPSFRVRYSSPRGGSGLLPARGFLLRVGDVVLE